jgi:hypothetical protein
MATAKPRPAIDERIDGELSRRLSPQDHRYFWWAESEALGGMTPYEALLAGEREAAALGDVRPPYDLEALRAGPATLKA